MNKKVLTLCAGFLLGGGVLSSLSAAKLSTVANDGKYYKLELKAQTTNGTWTPKNDGYCIDLKVDEDGKNIFGIQQNPSNYWRVASAEEEGTYYLINIKGDTLVVADNNAFSVKEDLQGDGANYSQLGYPATPSNWVAYDKNGDNGFYKLVQQGNDLTSTIGAAFDAVTDTNNDALKNALLEALDNKEVANLTMVYKDKPSEITDAIQAMVTAASSDADLKKKLSQASALIAVKNGEKGNPDIMISLNGVAAPANVTVIEVTIPETGSAINVSMQSPYWGDFSSIQGDDDTFVMVAYGMAIRAKKDDNGNTVYEQATYDPSESNAAQYQWTFAPRETNPGQYVLSVKNNLGDWLVVNNSWVEVRNVTVTKDANGNFLYNGSKTPSYPTQVELQTSNGNYVIWNQGTWAFDTVTNPADGRSFGAAWVERAWMYAEDLLKRSAEYFTLDITYVHYDEKNNKIEDDLTGIFSGELTPVQPVTYGQGKTKYELADPKAQSFMLMNENNELLVLDTNSKTAWSAGNQIHAYQLIKVSTKAYETDQVNDQHYQAYFSFEHKVGADAATLTEIQNIYVGGHKIGCYLDKQTPTLAGQGNVGSLLEVIFELNPSTAVNPQAWLTSPSYYKVTVSNKRKDAQHYSKVLGLNEYGNIAYVDPAKTDIEQPEGQFAIEYVKEYTYKDEKGNDVVVPAHYTFTNRENQANNFSLRAADLYTTGTTNVFAYRDYRYNLMDTLTITPVTQYTSADGFRRIPTADLNANTYEIALNTIAGPLYVIENHNDKHRIGLDAEEATAWRIEQPTVKVMDVTGDLDHYAADTVSVLTPIRFWADNDWRTTQIDNPKGKYYAPNTELLIPTYILKNTATDEYMKGVNDNEEAGNAYYLCDDDYAVRLALKEVGDSTVVLVPAFHDGNYYWYNGIEKTEGNDYEAYAESLDFGAYKIIGGTTAIDGKGVLKDVALYSATSNDLFVISETGARTYKLLNQDDKIAISLMENNDEVIYEDGEFANIDNDQAYDINPTLYVDTAYINRPGNYRYDYLLSVRPLRVDSIESCNNPNHEHPRTTFTEGDFLVVMRDSMDANKDVHNNIYAYNEQPRLAFVPGIHQNDTLYYTDAAGKVIDKEEVGNAKYSFAKFAFKMINEANNEFVIETAYDYTPVKWVNGEPVEYEVSKGYLRWDNSFLVVTPNLDDAEHFTMEASELNATANEEISAENAAVSVVATDGAVVIKGAAGKNVVIATILGKVVANETINSDNETIAVPAGIAVVSVDGESFKVVVK